MRRKFLKEFIFVFAVSFLLLLGSNEQVFAKSGDYEIIVKNGRSEVLNHSIEDEYREFIKEIVSTASDIMTEVYPKTFGHLKGSGFGLGLIEEDSTNNMNNAAVSIQMGTYHDPYEGVFINPGLEINIRQFRVSGKPMTEDGRRDLIKTISHETMHAMMLETLTAGMSGKNLESSGGVVNGRFPNWFIEGTAEVSGGGTGFVNSLLLRHTDKGITNDDLSVEDFKEAMTKSSLVLGREPSSAFTNIYASYGTGYLACMYLANIIENDGDMPNDEEPNLSKIRAGLDTLMKNVADGYSLDQAIGKLTKYDGLTDFEENSLDELANYAMKLTKQIKNGSGSVLMGLGNEYTLNPDDISMKEEPAIILNDNYTRMINKYPRGSIVVKGGGRFDSGYDFEGNCPTDATEHKIKLKSAVVQGINLDLDNQKITGLLDGVYEIDGEIVSPQEDGTLDYTQYKGKNISIVKKGHNFLKDSEGLILAIPAEADSNDESGSDGGSSDNDSGSNGNTSDGGTDNNENTGGGNTSSGGESSGNDNGSGGFMGNGSSGGMSSGAPLDSKKEEGVSEGESVEESPLSIEEVDRLEIEDLESLDENILEKLSGKVIEKINTKLEEKYPDSIVARAKVFKDTKKSDWYAESVKYSVENNIMRGTGYNSFNPNISTTRGMIVTILYRLSKDDNINSDMNFEDVDKDDWYFDAVSWAKDKKIANGVDQKNFSPNAELTRGELVTLLCRYAKYKGYDTNHSLNLDKYSDLKELKNFALEPMKWAVESGIINGTAETTLSSEKGATRAEIATIIMRFIKKFEQR